MRKQTNKFLLLGHNITGCVFNLLLDLNADDASVLKYHKLWPPGAGP